MNVSGRRLCLLLCTAAMLAGCAAREGDGPTQPDSTMHNIGLGIHEFADARGVLPPGDDPQARGADGMSYLSWRVHLLPYLEGNVLFQRFHVQEPWLSEHNIQLLPERPAVFQLFNSVPIGMTDVIAPWGGNSALGSPQPQSWAAMPDPTDLTVICMEAAPDSVVEWTRPDDFQFDPTDPNAMRRFGQPGAQTFLVTLADASVREVSKDISPQVFQAMIDYADGQPSDDSQLR